MKIHYLLFLVVLLLGCEKIELTPELLTPPGFVIAYNNFEATTISSSDVLERAYQMANVKWTPLDNIPFNNKSYFPPGVKVTGIPYSSVKEINPPSSMRMRLSSRSFFIAIEIEGFE